MQHTFCFLFFFWVPVKAHQSAITSLSDKKWKPCDGRWICIVKGVVGDLLVLVKTTCHLQYKSLAVQIKTVPDGVDLNHCCQCAGLLMAPNSHLKPEVWFIDQENKIKGLTLFILKCRPIKKGRKKEKPVYREKIKSPEDKHVAITSNVQAGRQQWLEKSDGTTTNNLATSECNKWMQVCSIVHYRADRELCTGVCEWRGKSNAVEWQG